MTDFLNREPPRLRGIHSGILTPMARRSAARALVRIPGETYSTLKKLSKETARPMSEVVAEAVERYRRERFLAEANAAYDALSPSAKRKYREESAAWDATLLDGLSVDEP